MEMQPDRVNGKLRISVTNLKDFEVLIEKANDQMKELQSTINKLQRFDIEVEFKTTER